MNDKTGQEAEAHAFAELLRTQGEFRQARLRMNRCRRAWLRLVEEGDTTDTAPLGGLSVRARNCLTVAGIKPEDLPNVKDSGLLRLPHLGRHTLEEIRAWQAWKVDP
tara:strand:- start:77 stop:397 length:321 start_codon:yes stop_codon:yes gene_type:complete